MSTQFHADNEPIEKALERALDSYTVVAERRFNEQASRLELEPGFARQNTYASVRRIYLSGNRDGKRIALEQALDIHAKHANIRWFVIVGDREIPL